MARRLLFLQIVQTLIGKNIFSSLILFNKWIKILVLLLLA